MSKKIVWFVLYFVLLVSLSFLAGTFVAQKKLGLPIFAKGSFFLKEAFKPKKREIIFNSNDVDDKAGQDSEKQEISQMTQVVIPDETGSVGDMVGSENSFSFAIIGDTQYFKPGKIGGLQSAVRQIREKNVSAVMAGGDLVSSCDGGSECEGKFLSWKKTLGDLASKTYVVQGNHDRTGKNEADEIWQKVFSMPKNGPEGFSGFTYSFDLADSHLVVLDSDKPEEHIVNAKQRDWLEQDLARNKKKYVFIFFHEPAYPVSSKIEEGLDVKPGERDALWGIIARHKVTAVFDGHEHIASRKKISGIYQFGFGNTDSFDHEAPKPGMAEWSYAGESFAIVDVKESKVTVNAYSVDGKLLNSFVIP